MMYIDWNTFLLPDSGPHLFIIEGRHGTFSFPAFSREPETTHFLAQKKVKKLIPP